MKLVERPLILLLRMAPDKCLDLSQRPELHAFHRLAQVCGCPCCSTARENRFRPFHATILEFSPAAAWAGVVTANSREFHAVFLRLLFDMVRLPLQCTCNRAPLRVGVEGFPASIGRTA
jgi:hypothetical protein